MCASIKIHCDKFQIRKPAVRVLNVKDINSDCSDFMQNGKYLPHFCIFYCAFIIIVVVNTYILHYIKFQCYKFQRRSVKVCNVRSHSKC